MQPQREEIIDHIRGSLWGAVLGDVIGAYLEFSPGICEVKVEQAFGIKGGGMHKLEPGQPTDDSELAFAVGKGLLRAEGELNLNMIAEQMGNWYSSKPVDVGGTIKNSVPKACGMKKHQAHLCRKAAHEKSQKSQSNGSLMAITPMSLWCFRLGSSEIMKAIREYTVLIHPNQCVVLANTFYTLVVCYLLNNSKQPDRKTNAYLNAKSVISQNSKNAANKEWSEFQNWLSLIDRALKQQLVLHEQLPAHRQQGWIKIAFCYSIVFLCVKTDYQASIHDMLMQKGDTDTNACILGGLVGAFEGYHSIHSQMGTQIEKIRNWRPQHYHRPKWMVPGLVVDQLAERIIELAPRELKVIGSAVEYSHSYN